MRNYFLVGALGLPLAIVACGLDAGSIESDSESEEVRSAPTYYYGQGALASPYTCEMYNDKGGLRVAVLMSGKKQYDFEVGAGGSLDEVRDANAKSILGPGVGNKTDRVVQFVTYSSAGYLSGPGAQTAKTDQRYNVNQAGTTRNSFAPITGATVSASNCTIEVWSVPDAQWRDDLSLQSYMQGKYASYVRYQLVGQGEIQVHRVVYFGSLTSTGGHFTTNEDTVYQDEVRGITPPAATVIADTGAIDHLDDFWFEAWNPFAQARYKSATIGTTNYTPTASATYNANVSTSSGYAVALPVKANDVSIGVAFGRQQAACVGTCQIGTTNIFVGYDGSRDVLVLDPVITGVISPNTFFDQTFYIVPAPQGATPTYLGMMNSIAGTVPPTMIYGKVDVSRLPSAIQGIGSTLKTIFNGAGIGGNGSIGTTTTNQLGAWVKP